MTCKVKNNKLQGGRCSQKINCKERMAIIGEWWVARKSFWSVNENSRRKIKGKMEATKQWAMRLNIMRCKMRKKTPCYI